MDASNETEESDTAQKSERKSSGEGRGPKKSQPDRRRKTEAPRELTPTELALQRFQACGRCSYFVADLQVHLGRDTVQTAIEQDSADWLRLDWAEVMRRLARNAYIASDDVFYFYYDGTCPECRRRYTYLSEPHEDQEPMFRLHY